MFSLLQEIILILRSGLSWVVGGDFIEILRQSEICEGNIRNNWQIENFQNEICGGPIFTWKNNRRDKNRVLLKLDKIVSNDAWRGSFPNAVVMNLISYISDHLPVRLDTEQLLLQGELQDWSNYTFGNLSRSIRQKKEHLDRLVMDPRISVMANDIDNVEREIKELLKIKDFVWRQRAKTLWNLEENAFRYFKEVFVSDQLEEEDIQKITNNIQRKVSDVMAAELDKVSCHPRSSFVWKGFMAVREVLLRGGLWRVGNGKDISLSDDKWVRGMSNGITLMNLVAQKGGSQNGWGLLWTMLEI
ncbi:hypothetical protein ACFE04_027695 [Oxalis oulophora]